MAGLRTRTHEGREPWAIWLYPPSFRERYGTELAGLVEDLGPDRLHTTDLVLGAVMAWLRPLMPREAGERRRRRLQASIATTWVAWCAGFLVAPTTNRTLLDPPVASMDHTARTLLSVSTVSWWSGVVLVLVALLPLAGRTIAKAVRARDFRVLRPLWPGVALAVIEGAGLAAFLLARRGHPASWPHPSGVLTASVIAWLVGFLATVVATGLGPAAALTRARPSAAEMRWPVLLSTGVALVLGVTVITSLAAVALTTAGPFTMLALVVGIGATLVAITSSLRGVSALARA